jgi:adenylate cyclase
MTMEIERKFCLPVAPDWLGGCPSRRIRQGYVALADDVEVRVRIFDDEDEEPVLTVKRGHGERRAEVEFSIDPDDAEQLWALTEGRRVRKRRHLAERGSGSFEIDVYEGDLDGLVTAEIEFEDEAAAAAFEAPEWLGPELTGDERYENRTLATEGRPVSA